MQVGVCAARQVPTALATQQLAFSELPKCLSQVAGYTGLLVAAPAVLNQVLGYILPGLTTDERKVVTPTIFASSALFFVG